MFFSLFLTVALLTSTGGPLVTAADTAAINAESIQSGQVANLAIGRSSMGALADSCAARVMTTEYRDYDYGISIDTIGWQPFRSDCPPKHDTLIEYLYDTKTVCDTIWDKRWVEATVVDGVQYYKQMDYIKNIHCEDKEFWKPRITVRLTDEQYRLLMRWLEPDTTELGE